MAASLYAGVRIRAVTSQGDRFDFWVQEGDQEFGLEVSGTLTADGAVEVALLRNQGLVATYEELGIAQQPAERDLCSAPGIDRIELAVKR